MESFVRNDDIKRSRELRDRTTDPTQRDLIFKLFAEEEVPASWRPAESLPSGVLSKNNRQRAIDYGILLILIAAGVAYCGLMIGIAWWLHQ